MTAPADSVWHCTPLSTKITARGDEVRAFPGGAIQGVRTSNARVQSEMAPKAPARRAAARGSLPDRGQESIAWWGFNAELSHAMRMF